MKTKTHTRLPILLVGWLAIIANVQSTPAAVNTCRLCFQPSNPTLNPNWDPLPPEFVSVPSDGIVSLDRTTFPFDLSIDNTQFPVPVNPGDTISIEVNFLNGAVCGNVSPLVYIRNALSGGDLINYNMNTVADGGVLCNNVLADGWYKMSRTIPAGDAGTITRELIVYFNNDEAAPGIIQVRNLVIGTTPVPFTDNSPICSDYTPGQLYEVPQAVSSSEVTLIVDPTTSNPKCGCIIDAYPEENYGGSVTEVRVTKCAFTKNFPLGFQSSKTICAIRN